MKTAIRLISTATVVVLTVAGCARSEAIRPEIPSPKTVTPNGIQVWIRDVADNRKFGADEMSLDTPTIPPVRMGLRSAVRARAVGRLRNIYNQPRGALLLDNEKTAVSNMRELIASALVSLGYEIAKDGESVRPDAAILDVSLRQYWAWITSHSFSASIECRIVAAIHIKGKGDEPIEISASAKRKTGAAGRYAWQETYKAAHLQFVDSAMELFESNPLKPAPTADDTDTAAPSDTEGDTETTADSDTAAGSETSTQTPDSEADKAASADTSTITDK